MPVNTVSFFHYLHRNISYMGKYTKKEADALYVVKNADEDMNWRPRYLYAPVCYGGRLYIWNRDLAHEAEPVELIHTHTWGRSTLTSHHKHARQRQEHQTLGIRTRTTFPKAKLRKEQRKLKN